MPELPDLTVYIECLKPRIVGKILHKVRIVNPFLLRTYEPKISVVEGKRVIGIRRIGKHIILGLENNLFLVFHLMIAGRFRWKTEIQNLPYKGCLAVFEFQSGALLLTEAGTKRRASLHLIRGEEALIHFDKGGIEMLEADQKAFRRAITRENHTLKRALTDPRLIAGIGNSYSDEILHRARLSPFKYTHRLNDEETGRLFAACRETLLEWIDNLQNELGGAFPNKVTAFHRKMAVHGRYEKPCPRCGSPVQRIVYAENECNYCPQCQTDGRIYADRALSRLLKNDWPRTLKELEEHLDTKEGRS